MDKHIATVVRDDGVAGSNPATPTSLRTETRTDTAAFHATVALKLIAEERTKRADQPAFLEWLDQLEEGLRRIASPVSPAKEGPK